VQDADSGGGNGTEGSEEDAAVLPGNDGTETMEGAEACSLPIGEWQTMTARPELNSLDRAVGWRDGALHYMGDGRTRTDVTDFSSHNYGRFDPCSNTWQKTTIERGAEASSLHGWDGNGFTFHPNTAYFVLNTPGLGVTGRAGSYFSLSDETLTLVTEPRVVGNALVYPEAAAPEPLPVIPSYMNGATDGSRAFVWGQPLPTDEDPDPAPRGWMLDSGSLTWREVSTQGGPSARRNHSAAAAGERFVVW
jgi:hypothetical protein